MDNHFAVVRAITGERHLQGHQIAGFFSPFFFNAIIIIGFSL